MNNLPDLTKSALNLYVGERNKAIQNISKNFTWIDAFIVAYVISLAGSLISIFVNLSITSFIYLPVEIIATVIFGAIGLIIFSFIGYGFIFLFLKLFGGKAGFLETIKFGLALSFLPSLALIVFSFIPERVLDSLMNQGLSIVSIAVSLILGFLALGIIIWNFIVSIFTFSDLHKISKLRVFFALILPIVITFLILTGIALLIYFLFSLTI